MKPSPPPSLSSLLLKVLADFGRVDVLVNNAGVVSGLKITDFARYSAARATQTIAVNTTANVWTCLAFLPGTRARPRGRAAARGRAPPRRG